MNGIVRTLKDILAYWTLDNVAESLDDLSVS